LDSQGEKGVLASAVPTGALGCDEQRVDLLRGEETDHGLLVPLGQDGEHSLFVAISIRIGVIAGSRELRSRAAQTLVLFGSFCFCPCSWRFPASLIGSSVSR
jgi:hypothetical protein